MTSLTCVNVNDPRYKELYELHKNDLIATREFNRLYVEPVISVDVDFIDGEQPNNITKNGEVIGQIVLYNDGEYLNVHDVEIKTPKQGYGKEVYIQLGKWALKNGLMLRSDALNTRMTPASIALWDKLVKEGYASKKENNYYFENAVSNKTEIKPKVTELPTFYQNNTNQSTEEYVASEKTIRDLSARMSDRIGIPVRFESDRTKEYKGKIENNVAYINLAYATLDTPIHEILGHPIIRAIKYSKNIGGTITLKGLDTSTKKQELSQLYQNLLKELEYGKGKEVLDRIKQDYKFESKDIQYYNNKTGLIFKHNEYIVLDMVNSVSDALEIGRFKTKEEAEQFIEKYAQEKYGVLDKQKEEAIVELLGLMTADKLNGVKDGKLISLLKRLLKEIKAFVKDLLKQREVEIEKLPDNITLGDMANLLAYSNSKLILPGNEVIYTTPDNQKFKTYAEASKHISELAKNVKNVDLDKNVSIDAIDKEIETLQKELDNFKFEIEPFNKFIDVYTKQGRLRQNYWARRKDGTTGWTGGAKETLTGDDYDGFVLDMDRGDGRFITKISNEQAEKIYYDQENKFNITTNAGREKYAELETKIYNLKNNSLKGFIEKNKKYEQSKEIIEEWKKVNNIQYNPEEIYSRGQGFYSAFAAYSDLDLDTLMANILNHIEDNEKAGGEFTISAFTKPIDKTIRHIEKSGLNFVIFPKPEHIKWAANTDVFSGSVWDASEKINKDKKSELLGVSYTKYPSLSNVNSVQPNLASIIDNLEHHHNELGIQLTGNNFRLEINKEVLNETDGKEYYKIKTWVDKINSILDQKYGKLVKPNINKITAIPNTFDYWQQDMNEDGGMDRFKITIYKKDNKWFEEFFDSYGQSESVREITYTEVENQFNEALTSNSTLTRNKGVQPTQTNETLKESIDSVKNKIITPKLGNWKIMPGPGGKGMEWAVEYILEGGGGDLDFFNTEKEAKDFINSFLEAKGKDKEYTSQALINTKIAKLKEVAKKYPRTLIRSEVKRQMDMIQNLKSDLFELDELTFQKIPSVVKPGVAELFESNQDLANAVYEALGFINTSEIQLDKPRFNPDNFEATSYPIKINGKYAGVISVDKDGYISSSIGMAGVELEKEFQGQGYGTKVYIALAEQLVKEGKTLKSEAFGKTDINESANRVWKSLLDKGYAVDKGTYFEIQLKDKQQALQLYSQYLDTIFPDSKVKDIVYHGTPYEFDVFKKPMDVIENVHNKFRISDDNPEKHTLDAIYFSFEPFPFRAKKKGRIISAIINSKELIKKEKVTYEVHYAAANRKILEKQLGSTTFDALDVTPLQGKRELLVFEPEQIHILGNKQDIENFAKFVKNSKLGNVKDMENYINSKSVDYIMNKLIQSGKIEKRC